MTISSFSPGDGSSGGGGRSRRCSPLILGIVAVAIIVILVVIIAVVVVSTKSSSANDGVVVDGGWSVWRPWTSCSVTCSGGVQYRERMCNDPPPNERGRTCAGAQSQNRSCANWDCPDCGRLCPSGGTLTASCSVCKCVDSNIRGGVVIQGTTRPVGNVAVYLQGREWEPMTYTDARGAFLISDVCVENASLSFVKGGFHTAQNWYQVSTGGLTPQIELIQNVKPQFQSEPAGGAVLAKGKFTFTCSATATPLVHSYEWFKDGQQVDGGCTSSLCDTLELTSVQSDDSGSYRCRAVSDAGKTYSLSTTLVVQQSASEFCENEPTSKLIHLPAMCKDEKGTSTVDVGQCTGQACVRDDQGGGNKDITVCCGPATTQPIMVKCPAFSYVLYQVTKCGCVECSRAIKLQESVIVSGTVRQAFKIPQQNSWMPTPLLPNMYPVFTYEDQEGFHESSTRNGGEFTFSVIPVGGRVVLSFPTSEDFLSQSFTLDIPEGVHEIRQLVVLTPVDPTLSTTQSIRISVSNNESTTIHLEGYRSNGVGNVTLPTQSVVNVDGGLLNDDVALHYVFFDPREFSSMRRSPGVFRYDDEEGESRPLQTYGIVVLSAVKYFVNSKVDFVLKSKDLGMVSNDNGEPEGSLWALDASAGDWNEAGVLQWIQSSSSGLVRGTGTIPYPLPYISLARPFMRETLCMIGIDIYSDEDLQIPVSGEIVTIYTKQNSGHYLERKYGMTNNRGRACIQIPCGFTHEIFCHTAYGIGKVADKQNFPSSFSYNSRASFLAGPSGDHDIFVVDSPKATAITDKVGPFFRTMTPEGCPKHHEDLYTFRFVVPPLKVGLLNAVEPRPHRKLSWYQDAADSQRKACMVRVRIQSMDEINTKIVGESFLLQNGQEQHFGTSTASLVPFYEIEMGSLIQNEYLSCIQVKCPEYIIDSPSGTEYGNLPVQVRLNLAHPDVANCTLKRHLTTQTDAGVEIRAATNSSLDITLRDTGDYWWDHYVVKETGPGESGSRLAHSECIERTDMDVAMFDCTGGQVADGWWNSPQN